MSQIVNDTDNNLRLGIILNLIFTGVEFIAGIFSGSLALISDSGHNLTDTLTLLVSFFASKVSRRGATDEKTYGYGRATILAALLNSSILLIVALYIFYEAYQRILNPKMVEGETVIIVALIGIVMNAFLALLYRKGQADLNIKSVYLNMAFDAIALMGTLIAGILIILTKQPIIDPLVSILIGILLLFAAWGVVKDTIQILLEGVPKGISPEKVKEVITSISLVRQIDDLHIWAISSQNFALSAHLVIEECDLEKSMEIVKHVKQELKEKFHIDHATLETELVECEPNKESI